MGILLVPKLLTSQAPELCSPGATACSPGSTLWVNDLKRSRIISHIFIFVSLIVWIISRSFLRFLIFFRFCITPNPSIEDLKFPDFLKKSKKKKTSKSYKTVFFSMGAPKKKNSKISFSEKNLFLFQNHF